LREDACLSLQVHLVYHWHWLMLLNCVFFFLMGSEENPILLSFPNNTS
jgi:hypothetical protein